jgi:hypothetical protein
VVVGDHQALGRDERGAAAPGADDGAQRLAAEVGELLGGDGDAGRLELVGEQRELVGQPHPLARSRLAGHDGKKRGKEQETDDEAAGRVHGPRLSVVAWWSGRGQLA